MKHSEESKEQNKFQAKLANQSSLLHNASIGDLLAQGVHRRKLITTYRITEVTSVNAKTILSDVEFSWGSH